MKILSLLFFITSSFLSYAQDNPSEEEQWEVVDDQPDFPGGMEAFFQYIRKNQKYPEEAKQDKVEGKVFVSFVIDSTGRVRKESVKVIKGIGHGCDEEAIRLIKNSPKWNPGRVSKQDKAVPVRMVMPITFKR